MWERADKRRRVKLSTATATALGRDGPRSATVRPAAGAASRQGTLVQCDVESLRGNALFRKFDVGLVSSYLNLLSGRGTVCTVSVAPEPTRKVLRVRAMEDVPSTANGDTGATTAPARPCADLGLREGKSRNRYYLTPDFGAEKSIFWLLYS